jgi:myo-inositol-1(or 4)-monophosphatase
MGNEADDRLSTSELIRFAGELADAARAETLYRWSRGCRVDGKSGALDFDPVTEADRQAELAMRALIETRYPEHGITGEEWPPRPTQGPYCWSLDPVDGTRSFICRLPTWVTLIALLEDGQPIFGLIDAPCVDERYWGLGNERYFSAHGHQAQLAASQCMRLADARLSTTDPYLFKGPEAGAFEQVRRQARTVRYGHDGYAYARLAAGTIDLVIESSLKPHDYNALIPVVRAAGGVIGDWGGGEDFSAGKLIAAATPELFAAAVEIMSEAA